jgi:hypothetical protein
MTPEHRKATRAGQTVADGADSPMHWKKGYSA